LRFAFNLGNFAFVVIPRVCDFLGALSMFAVSRDA
jgi:hypothetical protein